MSYNYLIYAVDIVVSQSVIRTRVPREINLEQLYAIWNNILIQIFDRRSGCKIIKQNVPGGSVF